MKTKNLPPNNKNNRFRLLNFSELMMKLHKYDKFDVFHIDLGKVAHRS